MSRDHMICPMIADGRASGRTNGRTGERMRGRADGRADARTVLIGHVRCSRTVGRADERTGGWTGADGRKGERTCRHVI